MIKKFLIIIFLSFGSFSLSAQNWNEIYYLESEAEYLLQEKNYEKAIEMYEKILKEIPNSSFIKFQIGHVYLNTDEQQEKAIPFFEEALENVSADFNPRDIRETRSPLETYLYLGIAYQRDDRLEDALNMYQKYKESISADHVHYPLVNQYIKSCKNAQEMMSDPIRLQAQNLGNKINDDNTNFNPVFSGDGNTMVFTSYTKNYIDIFLSMKNGDSWSSPKSITNQVSKKYYLKTSSLSFEGDELFLVTDDPDDNDVFVSYKEGSQWANAKKLDKNISHKKSNETHASLSPDGNTLYFTSNREGGLGGLDIYKTTWDKKGRWGDPENLGPQINTPFNEETPFVSRDGKYLFFSSEGHNTLGGYDVFYIDLTNPVKPINMGYPVNTTSDDLFFVPGETKNTGYMARVEKDIYQIMILPDIQVKGVIYNLAHGDIIDDQELEVQIFDKEKETLTQSMRINNGNFSFKTAPGSYQISILNNDFEPFKQEITIPENYDKEHFVFNAELQPKTEEPEFMAEELQDSIEQGVESEYVAETIAQENEIDKIETDQQNIKEEPLATTETLEPAVEEKTAEELSVMFETAKGGKTFSVQLMALKTPVKLSYFKDVENISVTKCPDGFYRYTVGLANSYQEAQQLRLQINELGYTDAFVKENQFIANYTIQFMALIVPVELTYFKNLSTFTAIKGTDDFYRYSFGYFSTYNQAKAMLESIKNLGYEGAFVKKLN
jgi:tetratricopeptide (TPR) repeat protein